MQIEFKLRFISHDITSLTQVFAVFDCCRVPISGMPGLLQGRGAGADQLEGSEESDEEKPCNYFQIQACGPGGIADADGGFAKKLFDVCVKHAERKPNEGFMLWPRDFSKVKWHPGELSMSGGEDYLVPFGAKVP